MDHYTPPLKCSKCGSLRSEHVTRVEVSFTRCLECGHEGTHMPRQLPPGRSADPLVAAYVSKLEHPTF